MFLQLDRTVFHFISLNLTRFLQRMHLVYVIYHLLSTMFGKLFMPVAHLILLLLVKIQGV